MAITGRVTQDQYGMWQEIEEGWYRNVTPKVKQYNWIQMQFYKILMPYESDYLSIGDVNEIEDKINTLIKKFSEEDVFFYHNNRIVKSVGLRYEEIDEHGTVMLHSTFIIYI